MRIIFYKRLYVKPKCGNSSANQPLKVFLVEGDGWVSINYLFLTRDLKDGDSFICVFGGFNSVMGCMKNIQKRNRIIILIIIILIRVAEMH